MGGYLKQRSKVLEFDGDQVTVTYTNLKRKHVGVLSSNIGKNESGDVVMAFADQVSMLDALGDAVQECLVSVDGITDAEGHKVDIATIMDDVYFLPLVSEIIATIVETSFLSEKGVESVKKSPRTLKRVLTTDVGVTESMVSS